MRSLLRDLTLDIHRGPQVLLVTHDAVVLMLRAVNESLDEAGLLDLMRHDPVANASVSHWRRDADRWQLHSYNATGHLNDPTDWPSQPGHPSQA